MNLKKLIFISTIFFILFYFYPISLNFNELPSVSKTYAVSDINQEQLNETASILNSIQNIINKLKIEIQSLLGREARAQADITTGLVGHWKFDEGAGVTVGDFSGNNNAGTLTNGPTWTIGKIGGALSFDGVNDYAGLGDVNQLDGLSSITISAWVKADALSSTLGKQQ